MAAYSCSALFRMVARMHLERCLELFRLDSTHATTLLSSSLSHVFLLLILTLNEVVDTLFMAPPGLSYCMLTDSNHAPGVLWPRRPWAISTVYPSGS